MKKGQMAHFKAPNKKGKVTTKTGVIVEVTRAYVSVKSGRKTFEVLHSDVQPYEC